MPTYIGLFKFTNQEIQDIKNAPKRIQEAMGGKVVGFYTIMGEYDYMAIGEAPNDGGQATFALALGVQGNIRTTTVKAFTKEEFAKIVKNLSS